MTTTVADNLPRDNRGKWKRQIATAERDAEAARLASMGWSYSKIATELGYSDKGDAHRGARRALADLAQSHGAEELRRQQIESNKALREKLWEIVEHPGPLVDRVGRPVHDDDGNPVYDAQAVIAAATTILKCDERIAHLAGLDAPRRSVSMSLDQALDEARRAAAAEYGYDAEVDAGEAFTAWLEHGAALDLGRLHFPPVAELSEEDQAVVRELIAESAVRAKQRVVVGTLVRQRKPKPIGNAR